MAKLVYASVFAVIATIMVVCMAHMGRTTGQKEKQVSRQIGLLFIMNCIYLVSLYMNHAVVLEWAHCLILICEVMIMYMFLMFGYRFTDVPFMEVKPVLYFVNVLVGVDVAITLLHLLTGKLYSFQVIELGQSEKYVLPELTGWYFYHIGLCMALQLILVLLMFYKACTVSKVYRFRYACISITFALGGILSFVFRRSMDFVILPIIPCITMCEGMVFFLYYQLPRIRIDKMEDFMIHNISTPVLMFDCYDELQVFNRFALEELHVEKGMALGDYVQSNNLRYILTSERRKAGKTKEFTLTLNHGERTYLIHGQEIWEKENHFGGTMLVYEDISKQEKLKDEAVFHATKDKLTGLWNREYFFEMVTKTLRDNPSIDFLLIVSDIHRFKMFNDILGKKTGDDLLITIAEGFRERKLPLWQMARVGGGRFALMMPVADYNEERFLKVTKKIVEQRDYALTVHFYLGVYHIKDLTLGVADMCDRAFMALESIKGNMRKNIAYYDDEIRKKHLRDTLNEDELTRAMKEQQFVIYLQPQIDTINNCLVGGEALARWISPKRGMIPPSEFIPAFEENCMIAQLDYYLWEAACRQLRIWKDNGRGDLSISVNISAKDFYLTDIYESITGLVEKYQIEPHNLKLEITETALVLNINEQMALVKRLQEKGFIVEIDDFGSGYSSLNSLKNINVDVLKLDMKFFEKTENPRRAEKIIESVVQLANNLDMPVIAEGVEELEQVEMLKKIGCHIIQGFYFAKPMPVDEYEHFADMYQSENIMDIIDDLKKRNLEELQGE